MSERLTSHDRRHGAIAYGGVAAAVDNCGPTPRRRLRFSQAADSQLSSRVNLYGLVVVTPAGNYPMTIEMVVRWRCAGSPSSRKARS